MRGGIMIEGKNIRSIISEGLVIAALPVLAYLLTFCYELGYTSEFNIPIHLITPNITTIFIAAGSILFVVVLAFIFVNLIYTLFQKDGSLPRRLVKYAPLIVMLYIYINLFGLNWEEYIFIIILLVFFLALEFLLPLIGQRKVKGYKNKLAAQDEFDSKLVTLYGKVFRLTGRTMAYIILYVIMLAQISLAAGRSEAYKQTEYLVIDKQCEQVALRIYGDIIIAAPVDVRNRTVENKFYIYNINNYDLVLQLEDIGPLRIEE